MSELTCTYCGGDQPDGGVMSEWHDDGGSWYCPGCHKVVAGEPAGLVDSVRGEYAAARTLVRACDEIDECYRRPDQTAAGVERERLQHTIEEIGRVLDKVGGERAMRRALLLVGADCDPDHLVSPMAGGKLMDPERKTAVTSHKSYIEREWTGIGLWQG